MLNNVASHTPQNLQQFHDKNGSFQIIEMIQMRTKLETPCTPQHEVYQYCAVVHLSRVKMSVSSEGPWMFRVVAHRRRCKECEVPILDEAAGQNKTRASK